MIKTISIHTKLNKFTHGVQDEISFTPMYTETKICSLAYDIANLLALHKQNHHAYIICNPKLLPKLEKQSKQVGIQYTCFETSDPYAVCYTNKNQKQIETWNEEIKPMSKQALQVLTHYVTSEAYEQDVFVVPYLEQDSSTMEIANLIDLLSHKAHVVAYLHPGYIKFLTKKVKILYITKDQVQMHAEMKGVNIHDYIEYIRLAFLPFAHTVVYSDNENEIELISHLDQVIGKYTKFEVTQYENKAAILYALANSLQKQDSLEEMTVRALSANVMMHILEKIDRMQPITLEAIQKDIVFCKQSK